MEIKENGKIMQQLRKMHRESTEIYRIPVNIRRNPKKIHRNPMKMEIPKKIRREPSPNPVKIHRDTKIQQNTSQKQPPDRYLQKIVQNIS